MTKGWGEVSCCCTASRRACNRPARCRISCGQEARFTEEQKPRAWRGGGVSGGYRGTSLIRNRHPAGPYSRTTPRLLWRPLRRAAAAPPPAAPAIAPRAAAFPAPKGHTSAASEQRGINLKDLKDFDLKAKVRIWPWLSCMCQVRPAAGETLRFRETLRYLLGLSW